MISARGPCSAQRLIYERGSLDIYVSKGRRKAQVYNDVDEVYVRVRICNVCIIVYMYEIW